MIPIRVFVVSAVSAALPVGLHFAVQLSAAADKFAVDYLAAKKQMALDMAGDYLGYERRVELENYSTEDLAEKEALIAGLNPSLVRAVMHVESGGKEFAESPKGAISLMQIMPFNAKRCGLEHYSQLWEPARNVKCGVRILAEEMRSHGGDVVSALRAYNGGSGADQKPESVKYARLVLSRLATDLK